MSLFVSGFLARTAAPSDFRDPEYGFAVASPEFGPQKSSGQVARVIVLGPPEEGFASNLNVTVHYAQTTLDEYIAENLKQMAAKGFKAPTLSRREVSGRPAVLLEFEGEVAGRKLHFLSLAVIMPDRVFLATYTAPPSKFAELEAEFRRSADTFQILEK